MRQAAMVPAGLTESPFSHESGGGLHPLQAPSVSGGSRATPLVITLVLACYIFPTPSNLSTSLFSQWISCEQ